MNKSELIDAVAEEAGLSRADGARAVDALLNIVQTTLKQGNEVTITGFGKFSVAKRAARNGWNPATGEPIKLKASQSPKFSPGATFKQAVNPRRR